MDLELNGANREIIPEMQIELKIKIAIQIVDDDDRLILLIVILFGQITPFEYIGPQNI